MKPMPSPSARRPGIRVVPLVPLLATAAWLAAGGAAQARQGLEAELSSRASITATNLSGGDTDTVFGFDGEVTRGGGVARATSFTVWEGFAGNGESKTMTFDGIARAEAGYGVLRTYAKGRVVNPIFNPDNTPFFDPDRDGGDEDPEEGEGGQFDFDGVPDYFSADAQAGFTETLRLATPFNSYTSKYRYLVTGEVTGSAFIFGELKHGTNARSEFSFFAEGQYSKFIESDVFINTSPDAQDFSLSLFSGYEAFLEELDGQPLDFGVADFENTLRLVSIELRDENGDLIDPSLISTASGTSYNINGPAAVPEPSSLLLLAAVGGGVLVRRRTKRGRRTREPGPATDA